jgi:integrase
LRTLDPFAVAAIRLLLFTGARLREILHAKWDYVDFERGILFLPDSKTGRKPV